MILYLMTHRGTGLKYLGFTTKDLDKYDGSGTHWKLHLAKHGNDIEKKVLLESDSEEEINHAALYLSEVYNVVDSDLFANLCVERGVEHTTLGIKRSAESRAKQGASRRGEKAYNFKGDLVVIHKASGVAVGTFKGGAELEAAGFSPAHPLKAARGERQSFGRTLPDGTKDRAAYTAMYAA